MRMIILIICLTTILSCKSDEIEYHVFSYYEKPEFYQDFDIDSSYYDDSLKNQESELFELLSEKPDLYKIFNVLLRENRLSAIAIYTYQENNRISIDDAIFMVKGKKNRNIINLSIYFKLPTEFESNKDYSKLDNNKKIEYILKIAMNNFNYSYTINKIQRIGFPIPVPDTNKGDYKE